jgi:hypothetical protein
MWVSVAAGVPVTCLVRSQGWLFWGGTGDIDIDIGGVDGCCFRPCMLCGEVVTRGAEAGGGVCENVII